MRKSHNEKGAGIWDVNMWNMCNESFSVTSLLSKRLSYAAFHLWGGFALLVMIILGHANRVGYRRQRQQYLQRIISIMFSGFGFFSSPFLIHVTHYHKYCTKLIILYFLNYWNETLRKEHRHSRGNSYLISNTFNLLQFTADT